MKNIRIEKIEEGEVTRTVEKERMEGEEWGEWEGKASNCDEDKDRDGIEKEWKERRRTYKSWKGERKWMCVSDGSDEAR